MTPGAKDGANLHTYGTKLIHANEMTIDRRKKI